ncbi:MAG: betaine--homocysteine S-methyltransferase [Anaerolineae bacterium]|nr:homocysteine S-methyltransferase family protein [Anaerolineales bacterium]MCQ3975978.1 methionine synthase [Anaerolineae bacterium]
MPDLKQKLAEPGVIILDGATGTQLQKMGLPAGMAPELWNLQNPEAVKKHYQAYIEAGSDAVLTNSFGGTRPRLDMEGSGHLTHEINVAAARLAREVAGDKVLVLGSMGPTGLLMEPMGELTYEKAVEFFAEQAAGLAEGGADGIHIETMSDLSEAKAAIEGAQRATTLPVTVTMSFDMHGRTMMGVRPEEAVRELWAMNVLAVGVNCGRTLEENLVAVTAMRRAAPDVTLIAKPNAGLPRMEGMVEAVYDVTPEVMADYALKFGAQGVKLLGGCCGSDPSHITAIKAALKGFEPPALVEVAVVETATPVTANGNDREERRRRRMRICEG